MLRYLYFLIYQTKYSFKTITGLKASLISKLSENLPSMAIKSLFFDLNEYYIAVIVFHIKVYFQMK